MSTKFRAVVSILMAIALLSAWAFPITLAAPESQMSSGPVEYSGLTFDARAMACDLFGFCWNPVFITPYYINWGDWGPVGTFALSIRLDVKDDTALQLLQITVPYPPELNPSEIYQDGLLGTTSTDPELREVYFEGVFDPAYTQDWPAYFVVHFSAASPGDLSDMNFVFNTAVTEVTDTGILSNTIGPVTARIVAPLDDWSLRIVEYDSILEYPGQTIQYWVEAENLGDMPTNLQLLVNTTGVVSDMGGTPLIICSSPPEEIRFTDEEHKNAIWVSDWDSRIPPGEKVLCSIAEAHSRGGGSTISIPEGYRQDRDLGNNSVTHPVTLATETPDTTPPTEPPATSTPEPPVTPTPEPPTGTLLFLPILVR